jgi:lipopolysaccharide/colanic/teichoic acid biosynthesis glycosyltransferase
MDLGKRFFDLFFSLLGLIILSPILCFISLWILVDSKGSVFYRQERIGLGEVPFRIYKFRTMFVGSDQKGLLTIGDKDNRVTQVGQFLRKTKLDEMPQLINVLKGEMSFVGPRPEVKKYVDLYTVEQRAIFQVRPGITDVASIEYMDEVEVLAKSAHPEKTYIEEIMPHKLALNLAYLKRRNLFTDIGLIIKTVLKMFR